MAVDQRSISVPSFAKINLYLEVVGRRTDGYHELCTIFQTVSLHDTLHFRRLPDFIEFTSEGVPSPQGTDNIVVRAAEKMRRKFGVKAGASIHLEKRIPSPGGLGGGSSNAAVTLLALSKLWELEPEAGELADIASELGSDVPFFLTGGTALGSGRGTELTPMGDFRHSCMLIVTPDESISTSDAFARLRAPSLTNPDPKRILQICRFAAESALSGNAALKNDFEESVFAEHPEVKSVRDKLLALGADEALLSGSGASVFGLFDIEETRQATLKALDEQVNWRKFAVAAISRDEYRGALERVLGPLPISF